MKKIQKILALALALALALSLAACGGESGGEAGAPAGGENTAPEITGVHDLTVEAGSAIDVLEGITASDAEDGDVTALITVEATPTLDFANGKATPASAGDYELVYTVTDKGGLIGEAFATLTVTRQTGEATLYKEFDFSLEGAPDAHGWTADIGESAQAVGEMKQGAFVFDITNPGDGDGAVRFVKPGFALEKGDYRVKIWAKSTAPTYAHFIARDETAEEWSTFGAVWNARIEENVAPIELNFASEGEGSAELMLNLGKITPNPDNAADTTPENFTVTIDKVEIYKITGEEHQVPAYNADFASGAGLMVEAGDGAAAEVSFDGDAAVAAISAYPTEGGVWSIKANLDLGDLIIEEGGKYYYSFTVNAENGLGGECLVESETMYHEARANFNGISVPAGEDTVIFQSFTAERNVLDPVIRMQIGNPPAEGVTANTITLRQRGQGYGCEGKRRVRLGDLQRDRRGQRPRRGHHLYRERQPLLPHRQRRRGRLAQQADLPGHPARGQLLHRGDHREGLQARLLRLLPESCRRLGSPHQPGHRLHHRGADLYL